MAEASAMSSPTILVTASRSPAAHFSRATLLGRSLAAFPASLRPRLFLRAENSGARAIGLAEFYNRAIAELPASGIVVFLHDDIYLHDWFLITHLEQALQRFDVVGLVGCIDPEENQPSATHNLADDQRARVAPGAKSGALNHFDPHRIQPDVYGPTPHACGLLDGCFLASRIETLHSTGLRFDPQFAFHCYDGDFCRTARSLELRVGTWPIACTHGSPGAFDERWRDAALRFRRKWCAQAPSGTL